MSQAALWDNMKIDLNCDMGEGLDEVDEAIMPYITSASIACAAHAGSAQIMRKTVQLAKRHEVMVGAHPGWPDREGFGRREMSFIPDEAEALVLDQIKALAAIARIEKVVLHHVKPHGALYNQAVKDRGLADAIARAVSRFSREILLIGLAGSGFVEAGLQVGLRVAHEAFPDRNYNPDGTLVPRSQDHALLESPEEIAAHAVRLVRDGIQFAGRRIHPDTLCLHGDHMLAVENARQVRVRLEENGIQVGP
jgi:UPF0271 protein